MRYLRRYENHEDIHSICREYNIKNYTINDDGSIDINHDQLSTSESLYSLLKSRINKITGNFAINNIKLTSLIGCPRSVDGGFYCLHNKLISLKGCPKSVGGNFNCRYNRINTFEGLDFIHIGRIS